MASPSPHVAPPLADTTHIQQFLNVRVTEPTLLTYLDLDDPKDGE
jgi:hypothetical protein